MLSINWRKYFWQITGTLLALMAIFATYDVFYKSKPVKGLVVVVDSSAALVDVKPEAIQDIEIYYKGQQVQNVYLIQLRIWNNGNQPIIESDYSKNLLISFGANTKIVDVSKISSEPPNIETTFTIPSQNQVELAPFLLNPNDIMTIRILAIAPNDQSVEMSFDGRIAGVKQLQIVPKRETTEPFNTTYVVAIVGIVTAILSSLVSYFLEIKSVKLSVPFGTEIVFSRKSKGEKTNQDTSDSK